MTQTRPRRRPLTHQEKLALQERKQRRREKMEESRELAKGPIDLTFCLLVMLLTAIGLVILLSASFPFAYYKENPSRHNPLYYFERQAVFAVLGTAVMLLVSKFNYQRLRGAGRALIYVSVIFLILVIIPHNPIAVTAKGATRWRAVPALGDRQGGNHYLLCRQHFPEKGQNAQLPLRRSALRIYSGSGGGPGGR